MTDATWVVVADTGRARIFRVQPSGRLLPALDRDLSAVLRPLDGAAPKSLLQRLAAFLTDAAKSGQFDRLVLAAPPQALGALKSMLGTTVAGRVEREIAKDMTAMAPLEIGERLSGEQLARH